MPVSFYGRRRKSEMQGDFVKAEEYLRLLLGYRRDDPTAFAKYGLIFANRAESPNDRMQAFRIFGAGPPP